MRNGNRKSALSRLIPLRRADFLLLLGAPLLSLILLESFARWSLTDALCWALRRPWLFIRNGLLLACLFTVAHAFRSYRVRGALSLFLCAFFSALGLAEHYKLIYRFEPVLLSDLSMIGNLGDTVQGLHFAIHFGPLIAVCALAAALGVLCWLRWKQKRRERSVLLPVIAALLLIALPFTMTFGSAGHDEGTDLAAHAREEGALYTLFALENRQRELRRSDYDESTTLSAWKRAVEQAPAGKATETPNVLFILAESFADQELLSEGNVRFTRELMPFYNELVKTCVSGRLWVPKVGGGTSETEFEVLTGLQSAYQNSPYTMGIPPLHSVAAFMREQGCTATALHWHTGVFYNRYENLRKMGFDAFYTLETVTRSFERVGSYVSDAEHYQSVLKTLRDTPSRDLILCLTMQNHGGYTYWDFAKEYGASPAFEGTYSADTQLALSNYCYLLERSDAALGDLITSLQAFEEPVWVVFFGDHLPPLGAQAYEELGLSLEGDAGHSVPYLIWSNRQNAPVKTDLKAYQLPAYALSLCGLGQDPFFAHVEKLRAQGLEPDEVYERLSYDALFGAQYAYRAAAYSPEAPDYRVGGAMTLLGLKALKAGDGVLLEPVLQNSDQAYTLLVNGETFQQGHPLPDGALSVLCAMPDGRGRVLNESGELSYAGAADLLNGAAALECEQLPLSSLQFELFRNELWSSYCVFRSVETVSGLPLALTLEGKALKETPADSMNGAGQYSLYEGNGKLYWSVDKKEMRLFGLTSEGAAAYLSTREMLLYLQREGEKRLFQAVLQ